MKVYTGIGSRRAPDDVILLMEQIGEIFACKGWTLRSGAAEGSDAAFEAGALRGYRKSLNGEWSSERPPCEIYLPWPKYNGHESTYVSPPPAAYRIAEAHHPNWEACNSSVRRLMARNVQQILGPDPTDRRVTGMVICWTRGGKGGGGTGQALRIAAAYNIVVFDLGLDHIRSGFKVWISDQTSQSGYS